MKETRDFIVPYSSIGHFIFWRHTFWCFISFFWCVHLSWLHQKDVITSNSNESRIRISSTTWFIWNQHSRSKLMDRMSLSVVCAKIDGIWGHFLFRQMISTVDYLWFLVVLKLFIALYLQRRQRIIFLHRHMKENA